jgi:hypothetical protein
MKACRLPRQARDKHKGNSKNLTCTLCVFFSSAGRTVLFMGNRVFSKAEVYDPLEKALEVPTPAHNPEA